MSGGEAHFELKAHMKTEYMIQEVRLIYEGQVTVTLAAVYEMDLH